MSQKERSIFSPEEEGATQKAPLLVGYLQELRFDEDISMQSVQILRGNIAENAVEIKVIETPLGTDEVYPTSTEKLIVTKAMYNSAKDYLSKKPSTQASYAESEHKQKVEDALSSIQDKLFNK